MKTTFDVLEGQIANLERSMEVTGMSDGPTSTKQMAIFTLGTERVLLSSASPAMIANGDQVKVVGKITPGQFTAIACKNLTTGWTTTYQQQGLVRKLLVFLIVVTTATSICFLPGLLVPAGLGYLLSKVIEHDNHRKAAHDLLIG